MPKHTTENIQLQLEFPETKLCECGCGTPLCGQKRFIHNHHNRMRVRPSTEERFWSGVDKSNESEACWIWTRARNQNGYGTMRVNDYPTFVHRYSWELHNGPIPEDDESDEAPQICVLHKCDNPSCVNPAHLFLGTQADNVADRVAKGRSGRTMGRPGEISSHHLLTEQKVRDIRNKYADGKKQRALALEYGVSRGAISSVIRRKSWKHIP